MLQGVSLVRLNCGYTHSVNMSLVGLYLVIYFVLPPAPVGSYLDIPLHRAGLFQIVYVKTDDLIFAENVFRRVDGGAERTV